MPEDMEQRYQQRLKRYTAALRNEKPDRIPIRPFVAEFICKVSGYTCQDVTLDYTRAFEAVSQCCREFDWDAAVANLVYVWGGIPLAARLKYYQLPGLGLSPQTGFQYLEPTEPFMRADEYDALIDDPTGYLFNVWLPRVSDDAVAPGQPATLRSHLSFLKGGMSMMEYFAAFPAQIARMRTESGTVSAIAGILKAPLDILADKLRGYIGLAMDLMQQPDKVLAACEALMPHLFHVALTSSDPTGTVPIGFWMHRSCVPFISQEMFDRIEWPTLKPIIEELWRHGRQTLFYAEGKWGAHLKSFAELPEKSIVYHIDRDDPFEVHRALHHKFALSGGLPNQLLASGTPDQVRDYCKKLIDGVARDGGYIMDASAIIQNDARIENVRAMTEFTREYGAYSRA